ncbi:hypothetical protein H0H87_001891 [Tephrocybe sp. NHM501043]|nr:hypothetical protein H0H87_001891 [Tephrocybe sp. NHM501043]
MYRAYGKVRMGTHRLTSTRVAIKQIPKAMSSNLTREIHHHRQLHHPHVTQMYEVIATESSIWIVTELCCGGELFDYLAEKGRLSEDEAKLIFGQLCLAVAYLHDNGIVHRDLKLENVLLDERCRVKLGDFGFTREFEKGSFMETFCGTTGYASPEMLQGKKYQGPEVDVWSLGVILYCLLTGTLPFDDDDEGVMRDMIIKGDFEDPNWLSIGEAFQIVLIDCSICNSEARNLIKGVLQKDVTTRLTIPQILEHSWFTSHNLTYEIDEPLQLESVRSSESSMNSPGASPFVSTSEFTSTPTTPDETPDDPFAIATSLHRNSSEATIRKTSELDSLHTKVNRPETVHEEEPGIPSPIPLRQSSSTSSKLPPTYPVRTPARTKRRSVSSNLSDPASPTLEKSPSPLPLDVDFASLLSTPTPIIFSTPAERALLNTLSMLGFDTAQIVHSVLSDACDAAGAVWWMLKKKAEKRQIEGGNDPLTSALPSAVDSPSKPIEPKVSKKRKVSAGVQTDTVMSLSLARSAPQLAFVPPTPTFQKSTTPPRPTTPTRSLLLSPSDSSSKSHPSTPASSLRDKESKGRKARSGSVSIMQRATTALEAAGLVRKKSSEAVREDKEREREKSKEERRVVSGEEPRSSHGSGGSSKLTKSPPLKPTKDHPPSTPPPSDLRQPLPQIGSPWVLADAHDAAPRDIPVTPSNTPGNGLPQSLSTPNFSEGSNSKSSTAPHRNRANILTAFRLWFNEDRKGKRKESAGSANPHMAYSRPLTNANQSYNTGTAKRRGSTGSGFGTRGHRQRPSASSRRSSSVNSRRSSGTSVQMIVMDSPQVPTRRSFGSHTPNSDRGDYPSRPSSIRSFSMQRHGHRKSPSQSSSGSNHLRTASPMQKYHRRMGSGSSTTRVVRQTTTRPPHMRTNSATSSIHSPASSRPASFYELSENEGPRTTSPFKTRSRRSSDEYRRPTGSNSTFIAQKRSGPFMSPATHGYLHSFGRTSWKKAWGLEPPGWQSRTAHLPIEVPAISPGSEPTSIRDVFSGRQSLSLGDEDEWVDEDEDVPAFAGGLGQMGVTSTSSSPPISDPLPTMTLSPAPRGHRSSSKRTSGSHTTHTTQHHRGSSSSGNGSSSSGRQKAGHSPAERVSPVPGDNPYETETRGGGRRQLPASRSGPAFRHPIQEEDEGEEE